MQRQPSQGWLAQGEEAEREEGEARDANARDRLVGEALRERRSVDVERREHTGGVAGQIEIQGDEDRQRRERAQSRGGAPELEGPALRSSCAFGIRPTRPGHSAAMGPNPIGGGSLSMGRLSPGA